MLDLGGLYKMTLKQTALHSEVEKSGILVIPGMGSDPGTSNVLCRYGANKLDQVDEIKIRFGSNWSGRTFSFAIETILDEAVSDAVIFEDGQFREVPALSLSEKVEFKHPVGVQETFIILHSELATIPQTIKRVKRVSYFDTWNPETVTKLKNLEALGLLDDREASIGGERMTYKRALVKLLSQSLEEEKADHGWDVLKITVTGIKDGNVATNSYQVVSPGHLEEGLTPTAYSTGIPPSIVAQMIFAGEVQGRGVLPAELCVDPEKYLARLKLRRFEIYETTHREKLL
jgi:lysine 6-dehydrogenase